MSDNEYDDVTLAESDMSEPFLANTVTMRHASACEVIGRSAADPGLFPSFDDWATVVAHATDFVTDTLLGAKDEQRQFKLVHTLRSRFQNAVTAFFNGIALGAAARHARVVYKGGNVMRFVFKAMLENSQSQQPKVLFGLANEYLQHFKASDMDFGVVLDFDEIEEIWNDEPPESGEFDAEQLVHQLSTFLWEDMRALRLQYATHSTDSTFPALGMSGAQIERRLKETLAGMQASARTHNEKLGAGKDGTPLPQIVGVSALDTHYPRKESSMLRRPGARSNLTIDAASEFQGDADNPLAEQPVRVCAQGHAMPMFATLNRSINASRKDEGLPPLHFDLVRLKLAFSLAIRYTPAASGRSRLPRRKQIGGEIIDISIAHRDAADGQSDDTTPVRVKGSRLPQAEIYTRYRIHAKDTKHEMWATALSIPGLVLDLLRVLFIDKTRPWLAQKYEKRLVRIMGLLLCEATEEIQTGKMTVSEMTAIMTSTVTMPLPGVIRTRSSPKGDVQIMCTGATTATGLNGIIPTADEDYYKRLGGAQTLWSYTNRALQRYCVFAHPECTAADESDVEASKKMMATLRRLAEKNNVFLNAVERAYSPYTLVRI